MRAQDSGGGLASSVVAAALALLTGCGGGGGGGDGGTGEFVGGTGTGAGGVTVFWWRYGGDHYGSGGAARETSDGSFVSVGSQSRAAGSFDPSTFDACLRKVDARGTAIWERSFGTDGWDGASDVIETSDGGFALVGFAQIPGRDLDVLVVKTDADGALEWQRTYGDVWRDEGRSIREIPNGYVVAGTRTHVTATGVNGDAAVLTLDASGALVSEWYFGDESPDVFGGIETTENGGFLVAGTFGGRAGNRVEEAWALELDAAGTPVWDRTFGPGHANSAKPLPGGGFVVAGSEPMSDGKHDALVLRLDAEGHETWRRTLGGPEDDVFASVSVARSGELLLAGGTESFTTGDLSWERQDVLLAKLEADGSVVWQKVKGRWPQSSELAESIQETSDGGMIVGGSGAAHMMATKMDANGDTIRLGDLDVTLTIPDVPQGTIDFHNAVHVARGAVTAAMILREIGPFVSDLAGNLLAGATPAEICEQGGSMSVVPEMTPPLEAGQSFALTFASCATGGANAISLQGGYTMAIDAVTGSPTSPPYALRTTLGIDLTVTDDVGWTRVTGDIAVDRWVSSSVAWVDHTGTPAGGSAAIEETDVSVSASEAAVQSARAGSVYTLGPAALLAEVSLVPQPLSIEIAPGEALTGAVPDAPTSGSLRVSAPDGSNVRVRPGTNGQVTLEIDTNGDGTVDLTQRLRWEDLD